MSEHSVILSKEGRVLIPAAIRSSLGLKPGDALTLTTTDGEVRIVRRRDAIHRMQKRLARLRDPADGAVDALIRERRAEAADE